MPVSANPAPNNALCVMVLNLITVIAVSKAFGCLVRKFAKVSFVNCD